MNRYHCNSRTTDEQIPKERVFQGEMFEHERLTPLLSAIALLEGLGSTMESREEETIYMDSTMEIEGHDPVKLSEISSGSTAEYMLATRQLQQYNSLLNNPCEFPKVKSQIQGDALRVSGKNKDDLQLVIGRLRELDEPVALQFTNYR